MIPTPATCRHAADAAAHALGQLTVRDLAAFEKHLSVCRFCQAEAAATRGVATTLRAAPDIAAAPDLTDRIMAALPPSFGAAPSRTTVPLFLRWPRGPSLAAAATLAVALGVWQVSTATRRASPAAAGCAWIARQQQPDGTWDPTTAGGTALYRPAITALAMLALAREPARYADRISAAGAALTRGQRADGSLGAPDCGCMYNHAVAACALLHVYGSGGHPELREPLERAVSFIRIRQQACGGWSYTEAAGEAANTALTAWQVQALQRARELGWADGGGHLRRGLLWLAHQADARGQFGYAVGPDPAAGATPTLNAMGAYTLLRAGQAHPELKATADAAVANMRQTAPAAASNDFYRAFFTALAWDSAGEHERARAVRTAVSQQERGTRGAVRGSWAPTDAWGAVGGRIYATSLAVLTLQPREGRL